MHLERLVELEYLALRHGRLGSAFVYEILFDLDAPEAVAHIGLIDVAKSPPPRLQRQGDGFFAGGAGAKRAGDGGCRNAPRHPYTPLPINALAEA